MTPRRALLVVAGTLLAALAARHALTGVLDHDDVEHLHTAWMVSEGQRPFLDFFQKQSPLFWLALQPVVALAGGDLLTLALLGRLALLLPLAATALGLLELARQVAPRSRMAPLAPFLLLASPTLVHNLAIVRPDGPMAAAVTWAVVLLARAGREDAPAGRRAAFRVASGALFGLASALLLKAAPSAAVVAVVSALAGAGAADPASPRGGAPRSAAAQALVSLAQFGAGAALVLAAFAAWLGASGLLAAFWDTNVAFNGWLYSSAAVEDVPRLSRRGTLLLSMLRDEPWLLVGAAGGLASAAGRLRRSGLRGNAAALLVALGAINLALLLPNHLPFYTYLLLPLLAGVALAPAAVERALARFDGHRLEWRAPGVTRGLGVPAVLVGLGLAAVGVAGVSAYGRLQSSEGQIRKLQALPRGRDTYELPEHPVFAVDRRYVWDNVERYLDTARRMQRAGVLPPWLGERLRPQLEPLPGAPPR